MLAAELREFYILCFRQECIVYRNGFELPWRAPHLYETIKLDVRSSVGGIECN